MEKLLPLFPLSLVVYPNEKLNLHVFEPRYQQLITECLENDTNFGSPPFIRKKVEKYGTEVKILRIEKLYDDGRMDIKTQGVNVFKILNYSNPLGDKLYAGGIVQPVVSDDFVEEILTLELIEQATLLYKLLDLTLNIKNNYSKQISYEIGHLIGLSLDQEYELLLINSEKARQIYLIEHLKRTIPLLMDIERTKERIKMNGHFKFLDPLKF